MTDVTIKGLTEDEYTELKVAYAMSGHRKWKDFVLEAARLWKQQKEKQQKKQ
jgi:hypothetical protein